MIPKSGPSTLADLADAIKECRSYGLGVRLILMRHSFAKMTEHVANVITERIYGVEVSKQKSVFGIRFVVTEDITSADSDFELIMVNPSNPSNQ